MKEARCRKTNTIDTSHFYVKSRIAKLIEAKSRVVVARGWVEVGIEC